MVTSATSPSTWAPKSSHSSESLTNQLFNCYDTVLISSGIYLDRFCHEQCISNSTLQGGNARVDEDTDSSIETRFEGLVPLQISESFGDEDNHRGMVI